MSEWFHVGGMVVCVDDSGGLFGGAALKRGRVYTISAIEPNAPELMVQVSELRYRWYEFARASRFRPLRKRTTSIEVFTQLLNSKPELERA